MTLHTQLMTMISMVIGGIYLGFATETFRRAANSWKNNSYATYVFEITFWMVQTCILFFVLYKVNEAELRVYVFLACLLGFSMYKVLFQTLYKRMLDVFIRIIKTIIKWTIQIINSLIIQPIMWIINTVIAILLFLLHICRKLLFHVWRILFYPIKLLWNVIKLVLPEKMLKNITSMTMFCSTILDKLTKRIQKMFSKRR